MSKEPWDLTKEEVSAMNNLVTHGSVKASSEKSPDSLAAVYAAIRRARKKMGATSTVHAALMWDRQARSLDAAQPTLEGLLEQVRELDQERQQEQAAS